MRKLTTTLLTIGVATILTGCGMAETPPSPTIEETTTAEIQTEVTTNSPEEETTTSEPQDESNYDTERIKVTKWDMLSNGERIPLEVTVGDVIYEYIYNEVWLLKSIEGSDGTSIELDRTHGLEENKNGRIVNYIPTDKLSNTCRHKGFVYEGKTYSYRYENMFITGILDENNNLVAEYKYNKNSKGNKIEVINYSEDDIGDINSLRYGGYYYHEITGFVFGDGFYNDLVTTVIGFEYQQLKG